MFELAHAPSVHNRVDAFFSFWRQGKQGSSQFFSSFFNGTYNQDFFSILVLFYLTYSNHHLLHLSLQEKNSSSSTVETFTTFSFIMLGKPWLLIILIFETFFFNSFDCSQINQTYTFDDPNLIYQPSKAWHKESDFVWTDVMNASVMLNFQGKSKARSIILMTTKNLNFDYFSWLDEFSWLVLILCYVTVWPTFFLWIWRHHCLFENIQTYAGYLCNLLKQTGVAVYVSRSCFQCPFLFYGTTVSVSSQSFWFWFFFASLIIGLVCLTDSLGQSYQVASIIIKSNHSNR